MILPIPTPPQGERKPMPMRWDRYYDEPVPGDFWGRGPDDDAPARVDEPNEAPQRVH